MRWWGLAAAWIVACAACSTRAPQATATQARDGGEEPPPRFASQTVIFPWGNVYVEYTLDGAGTVERVAFVFPVRTGVPLASDVPVDANSVRVFVDTPDVVAQQTIFASIAFFYSPYGFKPLGVYDTPLWDVHASIRREADVQRIDCSDTTTPPNRIMPPNWIYVPPPDNCAPAMGIHALDTTAPEFNKGRFTISQLLTFYGGTYNGHVLLASTQTLGATPTVSYPVPVVPIPERPGVLTPTTLDVTSDAARDTVTFTYKDFVPSPL